MNKFYSFLHAWSITNWCNQISFFTMLIQFDFKINSVLLLQIIPAIMITK